MSSSHNQTIVVTTPPWAKDEPPTPRSSLSGHADLQTNDQRLSDHTSYATDSVENISPWWSFARPRAGNVAPSYHVQHASSSKRSQHRTMSWLASPSTLKDIAAFTRRDKQSTLGEKDVPNVQMPPVTGAPGYDNDHTSPMESPSTPPAPGLGSQHQQSEEDIYAPADLEEGVHLTMWQINRKRFRNFMLINPYAGLLFRFINISLTSSALGIALHIRGTELQNNILGALGSSSTVVIIFAPLTLVHVLVAIYFEYFGRPVGLWNTSAKLAYTLFETFFICACISWFSHLPRPPSVLSDSSIVDHLCVDQVALICLVGFSLWTYCINLIISLFRIFEKVKYSNLSRSS